MKWMVNSARVAARSSGRSVPELPENLTVIVDLRPRMGNIKGNGGAREDSP